MAMTPDELKQYVDSALIRRDHFALIYYVLVPVVSFICAYLASYLNEKGKNAATKEDVGKITTAIESSKQFFNEQLERVKAELAARSHYSKVRYEREMKVFEELWPKVFQLRMAVAMLRPVMDSNLKQGETQQSRKQERVEGFNRAFSDFQRQMESSRPFYPPTIWKELLALRKLCWDEATQFVFVQDERPPADYWLKAMENSKAIDAQIEQTCEAIRTRLTEFDAV